LPASADPARSFDLAAEEYERTRPGYPEALLDQVPVRADAEVLDLAAGTGKLTRLLVGRYRKVTAVEPLDGMRGILERVVPGATALAGSAERIPLPDAAVDAAFVAQALHWFAHDEALAEIARVLRPGGILCVVWNSGDPERTSPLPAPYLAYMEELHSHAPFRRDPPPSFEELLVRPPFGDLGRAAVPHDHVLDRQGALDNARSVSWIASREDREELIARLGELLPEGTYAVPNLANALWATRRLGAR
jgi:SAM-dependent methyltransferase